MLFVIIDMLEYLGGEIFVYVCFVGGVMVVIELKYGWYLCVG